MSTTLEERLARLEVEMEQVFSFQADHKHQTALINQKLDDLLALRNRGLGAFWLASLLVGTSIVGTVLAFLGYTPRG